MKRFGLSFALAALGLATSASAQAPQLPVPLEAMTRPVPSVVPVEFASIRVPPFGPHDEPPSVEVNSRMPLRPATEDRSRTAR